MPISHPLTLALWATVALLATGTAVADSKRLVVDNAAWRNECGSCHVAYPPQLLPAASWDRLLSGLNDHFGSDATLDAATLNELRDYARANAGRTSGPAPTRITQSPWFVHEHNEFDPAVFRRPSIGSAANCSACHRGADTGDFSERGVRIPR